MLGALCQIAAAGLSRLAQAEVSAGNRNADCLQWLAACEQSAGFEPGTFARVIDEAQGEVDSARVQNEMAFLALSKVVNENAWAGLMSELHQDMDLQRPDSFMRPPPKFFPNNGNALSKWLKRNQTALKRAGLQFDDRHTKQGTMVCVWRDGQNARVAWDRARERQSERQSEQAGKASGGRQATPKTTPKPEF